MDEKTFHTIKEASKLLRTSPEAIRDHVRAGSLRAIDISQPGSKRPRYLIPAEALSAFVAARTVGQKPLTPRQIRRAPVRRVEEVV